MARRKINKDHSRAMIKKQRWFRRIKKAHSTALSQCNYYSNNEEND
jgi:hypothetical protein